MPRISRIERKANGIKLQWQRTKKQAQRRQGNLELILTPAAEKPDRTVPIYFVELNPVSGKQRGVWQCRECSYRFANRRSWAKHKGIAWIHASGVEVCK